VLGLEFCERLEPSRYMAVAVPRRSAANIVAAAANDNKDVLSAISNFEASCVTLAAPGELIFSSRLHQSAAHAPTETTGGLACGDGRNARRRGGRRHVDRGVRAILSMSFRNSGLPALVCCVSVMISPSLASASEHRSRAVAREFQRERPCPSTGKTTGPCPGYRKDHVVPLACDGIRYGCQSPMADDR
jgi:hypothetical protein